ncbi:MAG TPA: tripartite tricarboxylate transporter substrate binding protein [Pseudolabrys sp.]|nr:tripartite tricarboxylate transporter substrate binding protein [Pseudolabrys sp.]
MNRREWMCLSAAALAAPALSTKSAAAQNDFPTRPIRLIVPYAPGGVVDAVARNWAERVRTPLGTVAVENQGGGGGLIGAGAVAHATPDGYLLLFGDTSSQIISPYLKQNPPYDAVKDFSPVSMLATSSTAIVVHQSVPVKDFKEFIAYAREHQKQLSYGSAGTGTVTHLAGELFKQLIKAPDILHVPYRGAGPGLVDLVAGTLPMMTPNVTSQVLGFHNAGKVRILAVCAPARLKAAPEIPAATETLPGMVAQLTCGVLAPAKTPQPVVDRIAGATASAVKDADFVRILEAAGLEARADVSPAGAQAFLAAERERLIPIIKAAGLQPT